MRPETARLLDESYAIRKGEYDSGHSRTLTQDEVEQIIRRVESEAREDTYKSIGLRNPAPDEEAVFLSVADTYLLNEAVQTAVQTWTEQIALPLPTDSRRTTVRLIEELRQAALKLPGGR